MQFLGGLAQPACCCVCVRQGFVCLPSMGRCGPPDHDATGNSPGKATFDNELVEAGVPRYLCWCSARSEKADQGVVHTWLPLLLDGFRVVRFAHAEVAFDNLWLNAASRELDDMLPMQLPSPEQAFVSTESLQPLAFQAPMTFFAHP
eukprot:4209846-Amphidinium_carterae.1